MVRVEQLTGIGQGRISLLERGKARINDTHLTLLSKAYNCAPSELLAEPKASRAIIALWPHLSPRDRHTVEVLATSLAGLNPLSEEANRPATDHGPDAGVDEQVQDDP